MRSADVRRYIDDIINLPDKQRYRFIRNYLYEKIDRFHWEGGDVGDITGFMLALPAEEVKRLVWDDLAFMEMYYQGLIKLYIDWPNCVIRDIDNIINLPELIWRRIIGDFLIWNNAFVYPETAGRVTSMMLYVNLKEWMFNVNDDRNSYLFNKLERTLSALASLHNQQGNINKY